MKKLAIAVLLLSVTMPLPVCFAEVAIDANQAMTADPEIDSAVALPDQAQAIEADMTPQPSQRQAFAQNALQAFSQPTARQSGIIEAGSSVQAAKPVENTQYLTVEQRLAKVEQQIVNIQNIFNNSQFKDIETELQSLQGKLDVQAHELKALQSQQRDLYQDLDHRMSTSANNTTTNNQGSLPVVNSNLPTANPQTPKVKPVGGVVNKVNDQQAYQRAYDLIKQRRYSDAITGMQEYLTAYPQGQYAASANYWLGELSLLDGNNKMANTYFDAVIKNYPNDPKVANALLKLGNIAYDAKQWQAARSDYQKIVQNYPGSPAAMLANKRLQEMLASGR